MLTSVFSAPENPPGGPDARIPHFPTPRILIGYCSCNTVFHQSASSACNSLARGLVQYGMRSSLTRTRNQKVAQGDAHQDFLLAASIDTREVGQPSRFL